MASLSRADLLWGCGVWFSDFIRGGGDCGVGGGLCWKPCEIRVVYEGSFMGADGFSRRPEETYLQGKEMELEVQEE